ncbi:bifunctional 3-phenylpropionate/cinnamic acid dioxygenase ferredoxin subunit [Mariniluteicoccus endophyticus]
MTGTEDDIALFRTEDDEWYALDDTCTHEEASLADGWIEGSEVECPLHSARFCLKTGAALCMPATVAAKTYRVEVRDDEVYLDTSAPAEA